MIRDINLMFLSADVGVTAMAASAVIGNVVECEGGFYANARVKMGTIEAGTTPTLDITVEVSLDDGTTWYFIGKFPQMVNTEDNIEIARPVWVPRPNSPTYDTVKVRLYGTISGTADYDIKWAFLEPLLDLGGPAGDLGPTATIGIFTSTTRRGVEELGVVTGA